MSLIGGIATGATDNTMVRIVIGGDVCPMGRVEELFVAGNAPAIFHDLLDDVGSAHLSIANLECPLVSQKTPIDKGGVVLHAAPSCARGFSAAKWKLLNLANNHSFDHGASGLKETIDAIRGEGLGVVGAGESLQEAEAPFVRDINGLRIVVYSMAEQEYSIADESAPGANPLDLIRCVQAIREHKQGGVFIVLIHGGLEFYAYPSPEMVRRCRFLVEMGADAVVCCHTHCPLPWETHANRPIVYGLGNLVLEADRPRQSSWYEGYLAVLSVKEGEIGLGVSPYIQSRDQPGARRMDGSERDRFLGEMNRRAAQVQDEAFLVSRWREECRARRSDYLCDLLGYNRIMRKLRRPLAATVHSRRAVLRALHLAQCESHRELLNTLFRAERLDK